MSGTVDQIQSQQIATLVAEVTALQSQVGDTAGLQAQITALQASVAAIQQQLVSGPLLKVLRSRS